MNQPRKLNTGAAYGEGQTPATGASTPAQPARPAQTTYTGRARGTGVAGGQVARPVSRYQPQGQPAQPYRDPYQAQYNQSPSPYQYTSSQPEPQPQPPVDPYAAEVQAQQAQIRAQQQAQAQAQAQAASRYPASQPVQRAQRPYQSEVPRPAGARQAGYNTTALEREQIEEARRRAQQLANQNARRRVVQQPVRSAQLSRAEQEAAAAAAAAARAAEERRRAEAAAAEEAANRQLTRAQQQALAYRQAAERKYGDTASFNPPRTVREEQQEQMARRVAAKNRQNNPAVGAQVSELDVRKAQPSKPAYNYSNDPAYQAAMAAGAEGESAQFVVPGTPQAPAAQNGVGGAGGGKPPRGGKSGGGNGGKPPKNGKTPKNGKPNKEKKPKKKSKFGWLRVLLITLLIIGLILAGAYALILNAIAPNAGGISLDRLLNTPKEFQDAEFNFVMIGVDRSTSGNLEAGASNDNDVNDGNTDMILYVHYNNVTGEMKMLQIPRDTLVTTDRTVSANYRINNIAMTQAATSNSLNIPALCEQIATMYQVPVDGYMTIRLEMLVELVDLFGGIELYVPTTMDYGGSHLDEGYQTLNGAACEFLLRTRHIYPDGDIGRLNMQRQFYSALFRKLKSIGNIWDVAKLTPAVLNYMETDISASKLVSFAVSMLKVDSSKIMICQMPVKMGELFNGESVVYSARQEDADLLNQYFRENTGPVDAAALQLVDGVDQLGFDISGLGVTDANVQFMGTLNEQAAQAQQSENLDGSNTVVYVDPTPAPEGESTEGDSAAEEAASEPAA